MSDPFLGTKLGNYRIERLLGRGRMGVVYLARDEALLRATAVKMLSWAMPEPQGQNPEAWFLAEARNVARVNHPHVVQIYGVAKHGTHCYIAMEYVDGGSADAWIEKNGPFSYEQALEILTHMADALHAAHLANVIHRDIKPENLLIGRDGKTKLGDFGMAHHQGNNRNADSNRAGTPHYTAPEIWRGEGASASTDLYALGATFHYLLTGRPPFAATDLQQLIHAHLNAPIPVLPTSTHRLSASCQTLLNRCLAKHPKQRFESAEALGAQIRQLIRGRDSFPPGPESTPTTTVTLAPAKTSVLPSVLPTIAENFEQLGFEREPFGRVDADFLPYDGEPIRSARRALRTWLEQTKTPLMMVTGEVGSGKSSLVASTLGPRATPAVWALDISCANTGAPRFLVSKALRQSGVIPAVETGKHGLVESFVARCLEQSSGNGQVVLVIRDVTREHCNFEDLTSLAMAAKQCGAFRLVLLGDAVARDFLASTHFGPQGIPCDTIHLPALGTLEVQSYVKAWLQTSHDPLIRSVLFTPDALLLMAHRSRGNLAELNRLSQSMLGVAVRQGRRVLDSWDAYSAMQEKAVRAAGRPAVWPTPDVLSILNRYRQAAGVMPRRPQTDEPAAP